MARASAALATPPPPEALSLLSDREWRLRNLYWVINEHGRRVLFQPNWAQEELFSSLGFKNLDLKVRQIGITTGYCILWLDTCLFNPNVQVGIVAHTKDAVSDIIRSKIRYAYDNLPRELQAANELTTDNAEELGWANGSRIRAGVTFRSGTVQILHITEFGHICQHFPQRAQEVVSGSMQSVHGDGIIVMESTAKGRAGKFFEYCIDAQKPGTDWNFRFLPWYKEPEYIKRAADPVEHGGEREYLDKLQIKLKLSLTEEQRQWWCMKSRELGEEVYSEYPSTPEEAFRTTTQGAYYATQILEAYQSGRITKVPVDRGILVDTWWDLGINDSMSIWFVQIHGFEIRLVSYYENSGEGLPHYVQYLQQWALKQNITYGRHVAPHDIKVRELTTGSSRLETAAALGIQFLVAPMLPVADGIERVRSSLSRCWFDEESCTQSLRISDTEFKVGIGSLESYRKEWNPQRGAYADKPLHNWASHGADAFRTGIISMEAGLVGANSRRRHARPVTKEKWR